MTPFAISYIDLLRQLHRTMLKAIEGLPEEALDWLPGPDMNTLAVLVSHTAGAERYWIGAMAGGISSDRVRADEFAASDATVEKLSSLLDEVLVESEEALANLKDEDLEKNVLSPPHNRDFQVGWSLLHALEHTSNHVGHIEMTRQLWDQAQKQLIRRRRQ